VAHSGTRIASGVDLEKVVPSMRPVTGFAEHLEETEIANTLRMIDYCNIQV